MADLRPQDTPNPEEAHAEQPEEATGDPGNAATNTATDAEATRVPKNPREPVPPETGNRGDLYLPDMKNTQMKEACKKGIALGAGLFVVSCEGLKEFYDHTTLAIDTNSGNIEMYINGDFDTFPLNASEKPIPGRHPEGNPEVRCREKTRSRNPRERSRKEIQQAPNQRGTGYKVRNIFTTSRNGYS